MTDFFNINGELISPGQRTIVRIPIGQLPVGTRLDMDVHVFRSEKPGPVLLLTGGIHGDEINGMEVLRRALDKGFFDELQCGSVIAIPLVNVFGFISFTRDSTDGKDINRSFPGSSTGSMASRIARILTRQVLRYCTTGIDFHSGSQSRFNFPQIRFTDRHNSAFELAQAFNAPFIVKKSPLLNSLRKMALDMGIPIVVFEGGETLRVDNFVVETALDGLKKVMNHLRMADFPVNVQESRVLHKMSWLRTNCSGLFYPEVDNGSAVVRGQLLGWIHDMVGNVSKPVVSKSSGYIICVNNRPVVYSGDPLFNIGSV